VDLGGQFLHPRHHPPLLRQWRRQFRQFHFFTILPAANTMEKFRNRVLEFRFNQRNFECSQFFSVHVWLR
jgi:hypothetical protein